MKEDKHQARHRRAQQTRRKIAELRVVRLAVHRTNGHMYAQVIDASGAKVLASASTIEPALRKSVKNGGNVEAAAWFGEAAPHVRDDEIARQAGAHPATSTSQLS